MSQLHALKVRASKSLAALHQDEEGINTIEMVLILCVAAVVLTLAFKFLWGSNNDGKVAATVTDTIKNFNTTVVTQGSK